MEPLRQCPREAEDSTTATDQPHTLRASWQDRWHEVVLQQMRSLVRTKPIIWQYMYRARLSLLIPLSARRSRRLFHNPTNFIPNLIHSGIVTSETTAVPSTARMAVAGSPL